MHPLTRYSWIDPDRRGKAFLTGHAEKGVVTKRITESPNTRRSKIPRGFAWTHDEDGKELGRR